MVSQEYGSRESNLEPVALSLLGTEEKVLLPKVVVTYSDLPRYLYLACATAAAPWQTAFHSFV
jgi:hypothetical protein